MVTIYGIAINVLPNVLIEARARSAPTTNPASSLPCILSPHGARVRLCLLRVRPVTLPHMTPGPAAPEIGAATDVLRNVFGYDTFRPGQQEVIETVLAGRDCLAVMPTGAGKSLTFQIPARILPGTVLVLSPLISLMKDQVDALTSLGFTAAAINSSLGREEWLEKLHALQRGEYEVVYIAPEALDGRLKEVLSDCSIS
ncbi:MAG: ATP-dependent DNA helicase RecQ, partial [Gemmatimonadetes bacterium]|nr:ATP-dependent DNA helicase RecQ [Gemmatimonadota bacterium]